MLKIIEKSDGQGKVAINPHHVVQVLPNRNGTARIWLAQNVTSITVDTKESFDSVISILSGQNV